MNIKPGDLFEWVYKYTNTTVLKNEVLYSFTMNKYVPCYGMCLCIGINKDIIHWISDKRLFSAETHYLHARPSWCMPGAPLIPLKLNHEH